MATGIIIGLLGGAFLVGIALLGYFLVGGMRSLATEIRQSRNLFEAFVSNTELTRSLKAFQDMVATGQVLAHKVEALHRSVEKFYVVAVQNAAVAATPAGSDQSGIYPYDEERAAGREVATQLRQRGIETEEPRITTEQAVGEEV